MPRLSTVTKGILTGQAALAVLYAIIGFISAGGAGGWSDIARVAVALLALAYLVGVGITVVLSRFLLSAGWARNLVAVILPPAMLWTFLVVLARA